VEEPTRVGRCAGSKKLQVDGIPALDRVVEGPLHRVVDIFPLLDCRVLRIQLVRIWHVTWCKQIIGDDAWPVYGYLPSLQPAAYAWSWTLPSWKLLVP